MDELIDHIQAPTIGDDTVTQQIPKIDIDLRLNTPIHKLDTELRKFPNDLTVGHMNTVSIPKHHDEIRRIIGKFHIFAASETNIKSNTPSSRYNFDGFKFFGLNREKCNFGGVGLYVSDQISSKRIRIKYDAPQPEMVFVECKFNKTVILVGVIYKSPSVSYTIYEQIAETLAFFTAKYNHVILLGDYNIRFDKPDWPETKFFKANIVDPLGLSQIIKKPTRITDRSESLIDLVMVSNPNLVRNWDVVDFGGISDHCLVFISYNVKRPKFKPKKVIKRDFRNFSTENFLSDVEQINWYNVHALENNTELSREEIVNNQLNVFENYFTEIIDKHAPFHEVTIKRPLNSSWMTDDILKLMDERDAYKNHFNVTKDPFFYEKFKELRNVVNHTVRRAKIADFDKNINSKLRNIKVFHAQLKAYNVVEAGIKKNTVCDFDPSELNEFFSANNNTAVDEDILSQQLRRLKHSEIHPNKFRFREVTEEEVKKAVNSLTSNACGVDKISSFFLKISIDAISNVLTVMFNTSIKFKIFPDRWKVAVINPIPKVATPIKVKDFRPISLLPTLSKIIEKLVAAQMKEHFLKNFLMDVFQSGYKPHHGCTTALLNISDYIYDALDNSEIVFLVLLDYSKAFDLANHELILAKLDILGFELSALCWLRSYLTDRCQKVVTEKGESSLIYLKNGVPQGSILGPLLFTILVNDISKFVNNCEYHLYADDTQVYLKSKVCDAVKTIISINEDLNNIASFSANNFLKINEDKSKLIVFGSKMNLSRLSNVDQIALADISMNNISIERVNEVRNLGIHFDELMTWDTHVNGLISSGYYRLKLAYKYSKFLSLESKIRVVECYILALFNYGSPVLQNLSTFNCEKIQKLQNNCVRFICGLRKYDHLSNSYRRLKMLKMTNRRDLQSLTVMHNILNCRAPDYLCNKVSFNIDFHDHLTRTFSQLRVPKTRTQYGYNKFFRKYSAMYNDLKSKLGFKDTISTATFKHKIRTYFLSKQ